LNNSAANPIKISDRTHFASHCQRRKKTDHASARRILVCTEFSLTRSCLRHCRSPFPVDARKFSATSGTRPLIDPYQILKISSCKYSCYFKKFYGHQLHFSNCRLSGFFLSLQFGRLATT
jgi:hypothetical protein